MHKAGKSDADFCIQNVQKQRCTHFDELDISDVTCLWRNQNTLWRNSYEWALTEEQYKEFRGRVFSAYECLCVSYFKSLVNKGVMKCVFSYWSCIMSSYSCIGSRSAVLALGFASCQYSWPRPNTTVLGHNTGSIWKHPFNNTILLTDDLKYTIYCPFIINYLS